jgi:hypothetical protein
VSGDVQVKLRGQVLRLNPRRRIAAVGIPSVRRGRSFRADYAMPGEALASVGEFGDGLPGRRTVGAVVAVRPTESGAEVDIHVNGDTAWQRLAGRGARVDVGCAFTGMVGADPLGGRVERVDID